MTQNEWANLAILQVIYRMPPSSPSTPSPRCTSSSSTASRALSTARSFGTSHALSPASKSKYTNTISSVRSRDGRRNRAPPPRIRYNKDGKKLSPPQAGKAN